MVLAPRWNPATELDALRRQMDRVMQNLSQETPFVVPEWNPAVELADADDHLILKAQLPGINKDNIDVNVTRNSVTISGEYQQQADQHKIYGSEFQYGKFSRTIRLPVGIQQDKVEADYTDGILTLHLPKFEEATNRSVKVNIGS